MSCPELSQLRILSLKILQHTAQLLFQLLREVTRLQYPFLLGIKSTTQCICHLVTLLTWLDELMALDYYQLHFFPYQKVSHSFCGHNLNLCIPTLLTARRRHRSTRAYQTFCREMFHACLTRVYTPLKEGMTVPDLIRCPDGHWRRAIYGVGPYIADYPEQVWLACIVQGWCPKCV